MNILLSAFACDPYSGSDEEVGWQWAKQLALYGYKLTVLTRASHKEAIERRIEETGECKHVRFVYLDLPNLHAFLHKFNRRNHIYYYFWQWLAFRHALMLHNQIPFDRVHHVTWVSFRQPSFMGYLGIPFYFGPVAGGDEIPEGYTRAFSLKQKLLEKVRKIANSFVKYDPLMHVTFANAEKLFFTSEQHLTRIPKVYLAKSQISLAIGSDSSSCKNQALTKKGNTQKVRLLFVGRCIGWKGMDLGLEIFALAHKKNSQLSLTIIGDGIERSRWENKAHKLGISEAIEWLGWLEKDEVNQSFSEYDVFFYPSLRDSGGFVVLEALQAGLPVVCFKLGGPGVVVNDTCGATIEALPDIDKTIENYVEKLLHVVERSRTDVQLSSACRVRATDFSWRVLIERIYETTFQ